MPQYVLWRPTRPGQNPHIQIGPSDIPLLVRFSYEFITYVYVCVPMYQMYPWRSKGHQLLSYIQAVVSQPR